VGIFLHHIGNINHRQHGAEKCPQVQEKIMSHVLPTLRRKGNREDRTLLRMQRDWALGQSLSASQGGEGSGSMFIVRLHLHVYLSYQAVVPL
jgi:hypothetical protein